MADYRKRMPKGVYADLNTGPHAPIDPAALDMVKAAAPVIKRGLKAIERLMGCRIDASSQAQIRLWSDSLQARLEFVDPRWSIFRLARDSRPHDPDHADTIRDTMSDAISRHLTVVNSWAERKKLTQLIAGSVKGAGADGLVISSIDEKGHVTAAFVDESGAGYRAEVWCINTNNLIMEEACKDATGLVSLLFNFCEGEGVLLFENSESTRFKREGGE